MADGDISMRFQGECPICGDIDLRKVYQDGGIDWIEQVLLCDKHEIVVSWGEPVIDSVRDENGEKIPRSEWDD